MVAHMWLRSGDSTPLGNFEGFIKETLVRLEGKKVGLVRLDCGFYLKNIFKLLESKELNYIVSAPMHEKLKMKLAGETIWLRLADGVEVASGEYRADGWKTERRIIMIRQGIIKRPKAGRKQLKLFSFLVYGSVLSLLDSLLVFLMRNLGLNLFRTGL